MTRRFLLPLLSICAFLAPAPAASAVLDRIVIRVNDQIVTYGDYERAVTDQRQAALGASDLDPAQRQRYIDEAPVQVARSLYEELLMLSRARQLGLDVPDAAVDDAVHQTMERMGLEDEAELSRALASSGLTLDEMRDRVRRNLLVQQVMGTEVRDRIDIPDEEIRKVYRQEQENFRVPAGLKLREMVVLADRIEDRAERERAARAIVEEIRRGAPFEEVAARESEDGTVSSAIDLGWVEPGDLDPELEAAVWELDPGEVSDPIDARGGHHVIQVLERRESSIRPFEEVKEALTSRERQKRFPEEYGAYLRELESQAYVVFDLPPEAASFDGLAADETSDTETE